MLSSFHSLVSPNIWHLSYQKCNSLERRLNSIELSDDEGTAWWQLQNILFQTNIYRYYTWPKDVFFWILIEKAITDQSGQNQKRSKNWLKFRIILKICYSFIPICQCTITMQKPLWLHQWITHFKKSSISTLVALQPLALISRNKKKRWKSWDIFKKKKRLHVKQQMEVNP